MYACPRDSTEHCSSIPLPRSYVTTSFTNSLLIHKIGTTDIRAGHHRSVLRSLHPNNTRRRAASVLEQFSLEGFLRSHFYQDGLNLEDSPSLLSIPLAGLALCSNHAVIQQNTNTSRTQHHRYSVSTPVLSRGVIDKLISTITQDLTQTV